MKLLCGPEHDQRLFELSLPVEPEIPNPLVKKLYLRTKGLKDANTIGVLVSGGIDSAILYYSLLLENYATGNKFSITPYTIMRKEGSRFYAIKVIDWIHNHMGLPKGTLNLVGDNTLPEMLQVVSGSKEILKNFADYVYIGVIESRPEHSINWDRPTLKETHRIKYPLLNLQKSHVIDLYRKLNVLDLLNCTHSCAINELVSCGTCNGCNERTWGLTELEI